MNHAALRKVLGYLNLSSGTFDPQFYQGLNEAFASAADDSPAGQPAWRTLREQLNAELAEVSGRVAGFETTEQAAESIRLVFDAVLPEYKKFHRDLLAHQDEEALYRPFFIAKACQATLAQEGPWSETSRIARGAVARLNDFIGHRPVAVLRTAQKIEPYRHEWVCPIPLFVAGAGVAVGRYHDLIAAAIEVLGATDRTILDKASFDPDRLRELALDPRAYDFDHPANKRPNYHFGQWDPHTIDNSGYYTRFVLQAVTLDALLERVDEAPDDAPFRLQEAAVVLAGTILMAAGVSGSGPETHDSDTTLANLLPRIAAYRDAFYQSRLAETPGPAGDRLRTQATTLRQPFGGARHDLNARLARLRGVQLQNVRLARLFATMGNLEATMRQAQIVTVASARMLSRISGQITIGHLALERGDVAEAARLLAEVDDLLKRSIDCGAVVDPWNILGFQGNFSLFTALENSVRDHRVDVLVHLVTRILGLGVRTAADAAATGQEAILEQVLGQLDAFATWWDRYGTLEVSGVDSISGRESVEAATAIASALGTWRRAGATGGDIAFWRKHVTRFQSPRAYALVIRTLLDKGDFLAATGLLVQWLSESEQMPLEEGEYSFHQLVLHSVKLLLPADAQVAESTWPLVSRFFDYLEANAGDYWEVPQLAFVVNKNGRAEDDDDEENLFQAAYEDVTYLDTTDDGTEGSLLGSGDPASDYELDLEAARLRSRLGFLRTVARLRTMCAVASATTTENPLAENLAAQYEHAAQCEEGLGRLLTTLHQYRIAEPAGTHTALVEYDRRRRVKDSLLAEIAATAIEAAAAARWIRAAAPTENETADGALAQLPRFESVATPLLRSLLVGDADGARAAFPALRTEFEQLPILYVPLSRGGDPAQFVQTQSLRQLLIDLLSILPRLGLLAETSQLLAVAIAMERHRPKGERAITEFDRLFETGYRALVTAVVEASVGGEESATTADVELVETLQSITEPLLRLWLEHSRSVRLSAVEKLAESERYKSLVEFIERYGHDLFTQRFLNLGSLRAILDQGAENYLQLLEEEGDASTLKLIKDLSADEPPLTRAAAAAHLQTVAEVIVENYSEYKDYNSTTTQSDHGELLYTLIDCLRLKASYERVCWNIRPIVQAHEVLMRHGQIDTAELWRRALAERTGEAADALQKQFEVLGQRYQMRLPSIAARLAERFVRPLVVDGLRALVAPAIEEIRQGGPGEAFLRLESEIRELAEQPAGSGVEVPPWLAALEAEAARVQVEDDEHDAEADLCARVRSVRLTLADVQRQLSE
jgi:hypothetical protein